MKILANENFPTPSARFLSQQGYDVIHIGKDFFGISDEDVIQKAIEQERLIITFDRDYGELIFKKGLKPKAGVLYLRIFEFGPEDPGILVHNLFKQEISFTNSLSVFDGKILRQKVY